MSSPTPEGTSGGALTIHQQIDLLDHLVSGELSPATRDLYRKLTDLRLDRSGEQWDRLAAAVGRHFPCFRAAIALVWDHCLNVPMDELDRCCEVEL